MQASSEFPVRIGKPQPKHNSRRQQADKQADSQVCKRRFDRGMDSGAMDHGGEVFQSGQVDDFLG
ncbi:hypothetical protein D3C78_1673410 [compost metagenome]